VINGHDRRPEVAGRRQEEEEEELSLGRGLCASAAASLCATSAAAAAAAGYASPTRELCLASGRTCVTCVGRLAFGAPNGSGGGGPRAQTRPRKSAPA